MRLCIIHSLCHGKVGADVRTLHFKECRGESLGSRMGDIPIHTSRIITWVSFWAQNQSSAYKWNPLCETDHRKALGSWASTNWIEMTEAIKRSVVYGIAIYGIFADWRKQIHGGLSRRTETTTEKKKATNGAAPAMMQHFPWNLALTRVAMDADIIFEVRANGDYDPQ